MTSPKELFPDQVQPLQNNVEEDITSSINNKEEGNSKLKRETWGNQAESFLSVLGGIIGLGNIWRFPYITYTYGGGAFLIPYAIFVVLCGFPMLFLETAIGQHSRGGAIKVWDKVPMMRGIGIGSAVISLYSSCYYILVMAWGIFYFVHCLTTNTLPWAHCDNWWNTKNCLSYLSYQSNNTNLNTSTISQKSNESVLSITEFWNNYAMRKSSGIHDMGTLENWQMLLCLIVAWIFIYFCIFKGVKSTGKVVYFTATFPYIIIAILLVQGCLLEGASEGILFYLKPNLTKLQDPLVWVQAGSQVCYSYAICFAVLVTFGSFNDYHMDCYKHCIVLASSCSLTSFIAGFAVFGVLGHMSFVLERNISDVVASGPGLAFQTYPIGLSLLEVPQLWSAAFFFMIILIAVDSQFCCLEGILTIIYDEWPAAKKYRELFSAAFCFTLMIIGIVFVTNGGIYVFELFNNYAVSGMGLLLLVMMQSTTIGWMYGADRFYNDIKDMIGYYPNIYLKICICFATPVLTFSVLLFYFVNYTPLTLGKYVYPGWANAIGWAMCLSVMLCIPGYLVYYLVKSKGSLKKRLRFGITPLVPEKNMDLFEANDNENVKLPISSV